MLAKPSGHEECVVVGIGDHLSRRGAEHEAERPNFADILAARQQVAQGPRLQERVKIIPNFLAAGIVEDEQIKGCPRIRKQAPKAELENFETVQEISFQIWDIDQNTNRHPCRTIVPHPISGGIHADARHPQTTSSVRFPGESDA